MIVSKKRWKIDITFGVKFSCLIGDQSSKSVALTEGTMSGAASSSLISTGTAGISFALEEVLVTAFC